MKKNNKEKKKLLLWVCLFLVLGLGIGYALLTEHDITNLLKYDKYNYPTKESLSFVVDEYVSKLI